MAERTIIEVMEDYKDCQRCEDKSCLFPFCNCSKPDSIIQIETELLRKLIADISLDRLEEICTAEKDGRCVVLPCKVGELHEMLSDLEAVGSADGEETYRTGYRNGWRNSRIELLKYLLQIPDGTREEAEAALEVQV